MSRTDPQFNLRIPQELKDQIEKSAKDDGRSINAQAVHLLQIGLDNNHSPIKNATGNYIFTEWRYTESYNPNERLQHNEKARLAGSKFLTRFFKDNPTYQLISIENITSLDHKGREVLDGLRIWYIY